MMSVPVHMSLVDLKRWVGEPPVGGIACNSQRASWKNYVEEAAIIHPAAP